MSPSQHHTEKPLWQRTTARAPAWPAVAAAAAAALVGLAAAGCSRSADQAAEREDEAPEVDAGPLPDYARRPCQVGSTPPGAAISLDREPTGKTTPAEITVWAGRDQVVSVELEGFVPAEKKVFAGLKDSPAVSFELVAWPRVEVSTEPAGAEVLVEGAVALAATPGTAVVKLDDPEVTLTVRKRGFVDVRPRVSLADKARPAAVSLKLVPAAYLDVESTPPGAQVLVDGKQTGQVTPAEVSVAAGARHELQLEHEGVTTPKTRVKPLKAGARTKVTVDIKGAHKAQLRARLKALKAEHARWSATLRKLEAREDGFAESAAVEKRKAEELERTQRKVDELQSELDTLNEDLLALDP